MDTENTKLECCGHMAGRHEYFEEGGHICLTGGCWCGRKKPRPKRIKKNQPMKGLAFRQYRPPTEDEL